MLFNYAFGHSIQSFFKKAHNAEKLARNKKRLQVAYEKYVKLSTRNTKDHKFFEQALHSNKLLEVVRAIRLFEAKCIRKNYKL